MQEAELGATLGSRSLPSLGLGGVGGLRGTRSEPWEGAVGGKFCPRGAKARMLLAARAHRPRSAGVRGVGSVPAPCAGVTAGFLPAGDREQGHWRIWDPTGRFQLCSRLCRAVQCAPKLCRSPGPSASSGGPRLGGRRGKERGKAHKRNSGAV